MFSSFPRRLHRPYWTLYRQSGMQGTTFTRSARAALQMAKHPRQARDWVRDRVLRRSPLELALPWVSWPCIDYLETLDLTDRRVFEYGGGGSTLYFLGRGCRVRTVESSAIWAARISTAATGFSAALDLKVVEMPEHPAANERALAPEYIHAAASGAPWDLILVDGVDGDPSIRMECLALAKRSVTRKGAVILDDSWRPSYASATEVMTGFSHLVFEGLGPARLGVTRTDVYLAP